MTVTCTTCNAENPASAEFCEECGIELGKSDAGWDTSSALEAEPLAEAPTASDPLETAEPIEPVAGADGQDDGEPPIWMMSTRGPKPVFRWNRPPPTFLLPR